MTRLNPCHPAPSAALSHAVMTMVALFLARLESPNKSMIFSVLLIAAGTMLSAYGEINLNSLGLLNMFSSEATESARLVMTQYLLTGMKLGPFEGVMYLVSSSGQLGGGDCTWCVPPSVLCVHCVWELWSTW